MSLYYNFRPGWIEVVCGSMFSGKTEELIKRLRRSQIARQKVQIFKPALDNRYDKDCITSHSEQRLESVKITRPHEILEQLKDYTRVVGIDEAQFFDETIVDVAQKLATRGIRVIVAGLDMDYLGRPFGPMPQLMAVAEQVTKTRAICVVCGGPASRSQRIIQSDARIQVGAAEMYEARCRHCFDEELCQLAPTRQLKLDNTKEEDGGHS